MASSERSSLEATAIEHRILGFIRRELLDPDATLGPDDDLLSGSVLDSIGVLRLAAFLGDEFRLYLEPGAFVTDNFRSVAVLARYVQKATGQPPADSGR